MKTLRIVQTDPINWDRRKMVSISPNSPKSHKYVSVVDVFRVSDWSLHCAVVAAVDSEGATPRLCRRRAAAGDVIVCVPSCFNVTALRGLRIHHPINRKFMYFDVKFVIFNSISSTAFFSLWH